MIERHLARFGVACVVACLGLFAWLHVARPSSLLDWRTRTLSQYALLDNGWAFDAATLLLAAGSAAVLAALLRARVLRPGSGAAVALGLWVVGLVGVVVFEKHNWSVGPSMSGDIHRAASLLAFLSLPAAAVLAGLSGLRRTSAEAAAPAGVRRRPAGVRGAPDRAVEPAGTSAVRRAPGRAAAVAVLLAGMAALLCFAPILWALLSEPWTGVRWWRAIPLGTVERLLGLAEVATVLLLARWATLTPTAAAQPQATATA